MKSLKDLMGEYEAKGTRFEQGLEEERAKAVSSIEEERAASVEEMKRAGIAAAKTLEKAGADLQRGIEGKTMEARAVSKEAHDFAHEFEKRLKGKAAEIDVAVQEALSVKRRVERQARWILGAVVVFAVLLLGWLYLQRASILRETMQAEIDLHELVMEQRTVRADVERLSDLREMVPVVFWPQETGEVWVIAPSGKTLVEVPGQRRERVFRVADQ